MTVLFQIEGVLLGESDRPNPSGMALYRDIVEQRRVVLLTSRSDLAANHLMRSNGIAGYADILDKSLALTDQPDIYRRQVEVARSQGRVSLLVTADPGLGAWALDEGLEVLVSLSPVFTRPEFRPDHQRERTPWGELAEAVERRNLDRASAQRLSIGEE